VRLPVELMRLIYRVEEALPVAGDALDAWDICLLSWV
jgi:hypothetical protein